MKRPLHAWFGLVLLGHASAQNFTNNITFTSGGQPVLNGTRFEILASDGQRAGGNLFHSFSDFSIAKDFAAVFKTPADVSNVLARVMGGNASMIDGTLRTELEASSDLSGANLYLINPSGIIFGPNAKLEVGGAFTATTADHVKLSDGGRFDARNAANDVLTSAPVSAFGFVSPSPAPVTVRGNADTTLDVATGKSFSIIAGDITLDAQQIRGIGARVNLLSIRSPGEALLAPAELASAVDTAQFEQMGAISMVNHAKIDASGPSGGRIVIRGGKLVLDRSNVISQSTGAAPGGAMDIALRGSVTLTDSTRGEAESRFTSSISTLTTGSSAAGNISISAQKIELSRGGVISSQAIGTETSRGGRITLQCDELNIFDQFTIVNVDNFGLGTGGVIDVTARQMLFSGTGDFTGLIAETGNIDQLITTGRGGDIFVKTESLFLFNGGQLATTILGSGDAGDIHVDAETVVVGSGGLIASQANHFSTGAAGDIFINAQSLEVNGYISTETFTTGTGGDISLVADTIEVAGGTITAETDFSRRGAPDGGNGGTISIDADGLIIRNGGLVSAATSSTGAGGDIRIRAGSVEIDGEGLLGATGIAASTFSSGRGGSIELTADVLAIRNSGTISSDIFDTGNGGSIRIAADLILLDGNHQGDRQTNDFRAGITSETATFSEGDAGEIFLTTNSLLVLDGARVSTGSFGQGFAGDIDIVADSIVLDRTAGRLDGGYFAAEIRSGAFRNTDSKGAGTVTISTGTLDILNGAQISVNTDSSGPGGRISIDANSMRLSGFRPRDLGNEGASQITAVANNTGAGGDIEIRAQTLSLLNGGFIDASTQSLGTGGSIRIKTGDLHIDRAGAPFPTGISAITAHPLGGAGGDIAIDTGTLTLQRGGEIVASTAGQGAGGSIEIDARLVRLDGITSRIAADSTGSGIAPGIIQDFVVTLDIEHPYVSDLVAAVLGPRDDFRYLFSRVGEEGANFENTRFSDSAPQRIDSVSVAAPFRGSFRPVEPLRVFTGQEPAGDWTLYVADAAFLDSGVLNSWALTLNGRTFTATDVPVAIPDAIDDIGLVTSTISIRGPIPPARYAPGRGGNVSIHADDIRLDSGAAFSAETSSSSRGGNLSIDARRLVLQDGARITASATGAGAAGSIAIEVREPLRLSSGSLIASTATNSTAGSVSIHSDSAIFIRESDVTVQALRGNAGTISLSATRRLELRDSQVTAQAGGSGGNITIRTDFLRLDGSTISANAVAGNGGQIALEIPAFGFFGDARDFVIASPFIEQSADSRISASSAFGIQGSLLISAPFVDLAGSLESLNAALFDASTQLRDQCARKLQQDFSSYLRLGRGGQAEQAEEIGTSF